MKLIIHATISISFRNLKCKKPDTKDKTLYDSIYMKCLLKANPQRQSRFFQDISVFFILIFIDKVDKWLPTSWGGNG